MGTPPEGHRHAILFDSLLPKEKSVGYKKPWEWRIFHILKMSGGTNPVSSICINQHPDFHIILGPDGIADP
jgi:hypothetical protein